jgi:catechol 2,3-dioxygenase-like lactoylglutathione lyase family enzyme
MFQVKEAFSGFSVNDLAKAKAFYAETLGLQVDNEGVGMRLHLPGGGMVFAYPKEDHQPATFTILDFVVASIDEAVDELTNRGVQFEHYEGIPTGFHASHVSAHLDEEEPESVEVQLMFANRWFHHAHQVRANSV